MNEKKRVVVTGMGIMTPIGDNLDDYYENLIAGKSAITNWRYLDTSKVRCKVGGDLGDYDYKKYMTEFLKPRMPDAAFKRMKKILKTAPLATRLTMLTVMQAYIDAGLFAFDGVDPTRVAALLGGHNFNSNYIYENFKQFQEEPEYIHGMMGICVYDTDLITSATEVLGVHGRVYSIGGTCTSSTTAMMHGLREIRSGENDIALITGGVLDYSPLDLQALILVSAISYKSFNDEPEKSSRPYDTRREGFVPSHGGGVLVFEELEHARRRKAKIYAEVLEVETNSDANHLSNPSVEGQSRLMNLVMAKAGVKREQVDYVNAHATSTPLGDSVEIASIKNVFGDHAKRLKVNAPKSMLGHTGWSAGAVESIAAILQMQHNRLAPSINIDELDPDVDIDVCANEAKDWEINYIMKNSFGFGGLNACALFKRFTD
ncbi:MAG: beta-ketoacyl-[acyl-carrier-protein] synthase family protein [Candidatus Lokiarchaeota archaeon]|nr:beta-ketoacyl-[acyl-carrier-protein] synthase family protein [Candidatus Lokiarchaeota archaeon]